MDLAQRQRQRGPTLLLAETKHPALVLTEQPQKKAVMAKTPAEPDAAQVAADCSAPADVVLTPNEPAAKLTPREPTAKLTPRSKDEVALTSRGAKAAPWNSNKRSEIAHIRMPLDPSK